LYGLVVYDFLGTGFVNGTIHCAYVDNLFRPKTSLPQNPKTPMN